MHIKAYSCRRFAGLKDRNFEFEEGLNIILGPNEAGKSTLVEGIYASLFKNVKLRMSSREDKEFKARFMPHPNGDFIDGEVKIVFDKEQYCIKKEWGEKPEAYLIKPNGELIKNEVSIQKDIEKIFKYGEATYSSVVFAKQRDIKEAINRIIQNQETTGTLGSILRRTIMELDGISIEKLKKKIDDEINFLLWRWDMDRNYPENNRGVSNPYQNCGEIVKSFYRKEEISLQMEGVREAERQFEEICSELKKKELEIINIKKNIDEMAKIEDDITKRVAMEPLLALIDREVMEIGRINKEWPRVEALKDVLGSEILKLLEAVKKLQDEINRAEKLRERDALEKKLIKIEGYNKRIEEIRNKIIEIRKVTKENIQKLDSLNREMLKTEAAMRAGVIIGKFNKVGNEVWVTKDLEERVKINLGEDFRAQGYLKIEYGNDFEIELKSGEIDFYELRNSYLKYKKEFNELLKEMNVSSIEEAKLNRERVEELTREGKSLNEQLNNLLGEDKYEELVQKFEIIKDIEATRSEKDIKSEIDILNESIIEKKSELKSLEAALKEWVNRYTNQEKLLDILIEKKSEKKLKENEINRLAPLPKEYSTGEEFKNHLKKFRNQYEIVKKEYDDLKQRYYDLEKELPESSYEELKRAYSDYERDFNRKLERGRRLLKIKETFSKILMDMDKDSFKPLENDFSKYLSLITIGSYNFGHIDKDFNIEIKKNDAYDMPIELLSSGTYDSVALALRFAMLRYIYGTNTGFVVLDDCLVDLDDERRTEAIKIIKDFAKTNQVIFTTCNEATANLLGGNIIKI